MKSLQHWQNLAGRIGAEAAIRELHTAAREEINRWAVKSEQSRLLLTDLRDAMRVMETVQAGLMQQLPKIRPS